MRWGSQTIGAGVFWPAQADEVKLLRILEERFNEEELKTLSFTLHVRYDDLRGEGKANKARELILYLQSRNQLQQLINEIHDQRPDIDLGTLQK